ncbi:hypothetical protein NPIL_391851 [Nephila pilipes]|uniref:Uncharacterized protein n=1 Tax=Nephila pilipes TaxID=299642 RepID=A0A8X6Q4P6_NEPPI|nr:hypothetical protein NPIL_391851 [Nephila pilipes]
MALDYVLRGAVAPPNGAANHPLLLISVVAQPPTLGDADLFYYLCVGRWLSTSPPAKHAVRDTYRTLNRVKTMTRLRKKSKCLDITNVVK